MQSCRKRFCCFFTSGRTTVWIFNLLAEVILGGGVIYSWFAKEDPTDALFATAALTGIALVCSVTLLMSDLMRTKLCGSSARNCLYEWAGCMASGAARFFLFLLGASAAYALSQATAEVRELNGVWTTNAHSVLIVAALVGAMAALANATVGLRLWIRGAETCCDPDANLEDLERGMTSTEVIQLKNNNNQTITGDRKMTTATTTTTTPELTTTSSSGASKGDGASKSTRGDDEQFAHAVVAYLIAHPDVAVRVLSSVATDSGDSNNVANSSQTQEGGGAVITNNAARATRVAFLSGSGASSSSSSSSSSSTTPAESISGAAAAVKSDNPFLRAIGFGGSAASSSSSTATSATAAVVNSVSSTSTTLALVDASTSSAPLPPAGYRGAVAPNPFIAAIQNNNTNAEVSSAVSQSSPLPPPGRQNRFISYAGDNPFKD